MKNKWNYPKIQGRLFLQLVIDSLAILFCYSYIHLSTHTEPSRVQYIFIFGYLAIVFSWFSKQAFYIFYYRQSIDFSKKTKRLEKLLAIFLILIILLLLLFGITSNYLISFFVLLAVLLVAAIILLIVFKEFILIFQKDVQIEKQVVDNNFVLEALIAEDETLQDSKLPRALFNKSLMNLEHFIEFIFQLHRHQYNQKINQHGKKIVPSAVQENEWKFSIERMNFWEKWYRETIFDVNLRKEKRSTIIRSRNLFNLLYSIICFIGAVVFPQSKNGFIILFMLILIRYAQRYYEIFTSFMADLFETQQQKRSSLTNIERFKLAIRSIIEISFLNAALYVLVFPQSSLLSVFNVLSHSISISLFNVSYELDALSNFDVFHVILKTIHVSQVVLSILLLTIAITKYLSNTAEEEQIMIERHGNGYGVYVASRDVKRLLVHAADFQSLHQKSKQLFQEGGLSSHHYIVIDDFLTQYCFKASKPFP